MRHVGAFTISTGLTLVLIALIQVVVTDPTLGQTTAVACLVAFGVAALVVFIVDQFYATDPLIPPIIFNNRTFTLTTFAGTFMAFVRNSITYNMIFYLQGPQGQDPLAAGINLIPYGIGIMASGLFSGALSDKLGSRNMIIIGPIIALAGAASLSSMDQFTGDAEIGGLLFLTGFGVGTFLSPNNKEMMLSVPTELRGVAAAVSILTMTFTMMLGIVLTFSFVLHSMSTAQLFALFISGGSKLAPSINKACLDALSLDYYIIIACCACTSFCGFWLPTPEPKQDPAVKKDVAFEAVVPLDEEAKSREAK